MRRFAGPSTPEISKNQREDEAPLSTYDDKTVGNLASLPVSQGERVIHAAEVNVEAKVNLFLLAVVLVAWAALTLAEPAAALDPAEATTRELAALEDAFALDRSDSALARQLADHYLSLHAPELAVAVLSASSPEVREDPAILHRLAQAYEQTNRLDDALATAELARARCARSIGSSDASSLTPVPRHGCTERTYAALDMHVTALGHMIRWGVTHPRTDPRAQTAYSIALRSARILSASAD